MDLSMLPKGSLPAPDPWRPYVAELQLGAERCPGVQHDREADVGFAGLHRPCFGLMPRALAEVVRDIPVAEIHLPADVRAKYLRQPQHYLALPGFGRKPDFMVHVEAGGTSFVIRSFEGKVPADTAYFVEGPYICMDEKARNRLEFDGGYDELEAGNCPLAFLDHRLYRRREDGTLQDVTGVLLPKPAIPREERHKFDAGSPRLDSSRLSRAPTLRWRASPSGDEPFPASEPRRYEGVETFRAHFGFLVWNGKDFESRGRVSDSLWPRYKCSVSRADFNCDGALTRRYQYDPFLDYDTEWPAKGTP
ncbi:hypothetical protein J2X02_000522 [Pseudoxanthomonas japonensis]|uniref:hypothetical protein n=1 Tax=Pseudoxanthomonas japonensis TaxID=69284 RepID=UPI00285894F3|nr:hypothetical protein [Pseudoxanthomonas japonensis]MDR7067705.1 hypothetical protein [Pseudoxanthomonas japonensis]